mgnify:CR=1 FL=1
MKTKYIKPSVEVIRMNTTSLLAGSVDTTLDTENAVENSSQILSKGNGGFDIWDETEE